MKDKDLKREGIEASQTLGEAGKVVFLTGEGNGKGVDATLLS